MAKTLNFELLNQKWGASQNNGQPGGVVTYSFADRNFSGEFARFDDFFELDIFKKETSLGFAAWEEVCDIRFVLVPDDQNVDIRVGWTNIDGPTGVLGRTTVPVAGALDSVIIEMDNGEPWFTGGDIASTEVDFSSIDFSSTITHEIGHAIGIDHSFADISLMRSGYSSQIFTIQEDDINAAQTIYGANELIKVDVQRFFNPVSGGHFFTADSNEQSHLTDNDDLISEGVGYQALSSFNASAYDSIPVYRFLNNETGGHFYTAFEQEVAHLASFDNFIGEGIGFRAFSTDSASTEPVYRFFDSAKGGHFFTMSELERDSLAEIPQFVFEGIAFYAYSAG